MNYEDENNELFNEMSGSSYNNDMNYQKVLADLGIRLPIDEKPIKLSTNRFGNFSLTCNSLTQVRDVKYKMIMKGFQPLSADISSGKSGISYTLYFSIYARFPEIVLN